MANWFANTAQYVGSGVKNVLNSVLHPEIAEQRALANSIVMSDRQLQNDLALQSEANDFSAAQTEEWNLWQAEREDTAIQRKVADMKKSGINPVMLYGNVDGASSSSPSVASASGATSRGSTYNHPYNNTLGAVVHALSLIASGLLRKPTQVTNNYNGVKRQTNK